jgi:NAD(P)-dependent dehydrogenase (short-subunit alcohol dehydrogenase family)
MANILITGASRGLGLGLAQHYLNQGQRVFHLGRSACPLPPDRLSQQLVDLADLEAIPAAMEALDPRHLDLVILNAGVLGEIRDLADTPMDDARRLMDINLWANKAIVDWLVQQQRLPRQLVFMSSGASVNGNRGWGAYSISKAALNMMAKLYAAELPDCHVVAYAPGLVHTDMQEYLCHQVDSERFPSIAHLVAAYGSEQMPGPEHAARLIAESFPRCLQQPSGSFIDIRRL